ncbi:MAG: hypothetical protein S0880_16690 [Actinomycetota bacterium]|nr:hypothetical protein [Actinomycetota bacterium]
MSDHDPPRPPGGGGWDAPPPGGPPPGPSGPPPPSWSAGPGGGPPPPSGWSTAGYTEASQATLALVLGILGIVACGLASPFAWWIGQAEVRGIDEGRRPPENRGTGNAGRVLGIVGTALIGLSLLAVIIVAIVLVAVGSTAP